MSSNALGESGLGRWVKPQGLALFESLLENLKWKKSLIKLRLNNRHVKPQLGDIVKKAEKEFQDRVRAAGCIVCRLFHGVYSPAEIHHCLSGGRRMGEMFVLGLCMLHHRSGRNDAEVVSRDHSQKRFEARYGTEASLLDATKVMLEKEMV